MKDKVLTGLARFNTPAAKPPVGEVGKQTEHPTIVISFVNPAFPTFEFINWKPGISMGVIERSTQLMIREAVKQHGILQQKLRVEESKAKTSQLSDALTT